MRRIKIYDLEEDKMKKFTLLLSLIALVVMCSVSASSAEDWQDVFQSMLEKGKTGSAPSDSGGLAYTAPESVALEDAIAYALSGEQGDRACECMTMAVKYDYNPYTVLKTIYSLGGDLEIDTLCSCATASGITKAVIAKAATDAVTPLNEPVYDTDEIAQSQCLSGLAYTPPVTEPNDPPREPPGPNPVSRIRP
jgi:hypothetical protein